MDAWMNMQTSNPNHMDKKHNPPFALRLFTCVIAITFALAFLSGFGIIPLPDRLMTLLGGAIFAEVVVILTAIYRQI